MDSREFQMRLTRRAKNAGVALSLPLAKNLETYFRLLSAWNRKMNLAGLELSDPSPEALDRLLIEPLVAARYVRPCDDRMVDLGSGGGSPAIPLALAAPNLRLTMVESRARKAVFLKEAIRSIGMSAEVVTARYEALLSMPGLQDAYDLVTIRAVKVGPAMLMTVGKLLGAKGRLFLFTRQGTETAHIFSSQLTAVGDHPLIDSLHSRLVMLERRDDVPRETSP